MGGIYSPIEATYGVRVDQILETDVDFCKYHDKLNKKLQKLRHRCGLVTKDTKNYAAKSKYEQISAEDFDNTNKLFGVLVLLHAERDMSFVEMLKLRARRRGKFKANEKKLVRTRLKKVVKTTQKLVDLTKNEAQWVTRLQFLIYSKLARAEYLLHGKQFKCKDSKNIANNLSLAFVALYHLEKLKFMQSSVVESLNARYEYNLKEHAGNVFSSVDLHNFITEQVVQARDNDNDELASLLFENGYKPIIKDVDMDGAEKDSANRIEWRSFEAKINDAQLAQMISNVHSMKIKVVSDYDTVLVKWQDILDKQELYIASKEGDHEDMDEEDRRENEQILLAYIKYNSLFTSISRDNMVFTQLWNQWKLINNSSIPIKITKFKEIERIVKNLIKYLKDVMELPGVYSDDQLMSQLELCGVYLQCKLNSGILSELYQTKGKYLQALALNVDSLNKLENVLEHVSDVNDIVVPGDILSKNKIQTLRDAIRTSWSSIVALAEYEKNLNIVSKTNIELSMVERLDGAQRIKPAHVKLNNLFPLRPIVRPVASKPTLFDLAFNYIHYDGEDNLVPIEVEEQIKSSITSAEPDKQDTKKRGLFGLFGR